MAKKSVVHLRVYKGAKMSYDEKGKAQNENQIVKIQYGSFEWNNFMKMAAKNGYCKIEVEKAIEVEGAFENEKVSELSDTSKIKAEVLEAVNPKKETELTADQKRIKELEDKLDLLLNGKKSDVKEDVKELKEEIKDLKDGSDDDKEESKDEIYPVKLREDYEELMGKKPHHKASDETLIEQMEEFKAKKK